MELSLSRSERELLKALYRLSQTHTEAHTGEVAGRLGVTPGTVTAGVKRIAQRGLVIHRPYRGIELTDTGEQLATAVIRRHRIVERFLADMLHYDWQDADRLAATFEHELPREVEERLFEELGCPSSCPHGFPIPGRESSSMPPSRLLSELSPGDAGVVAIPDDAGVDVLAFLETLGAGPGAHIELRERKPFDGPLVVRVAGSDHLVGDRMADSIYVMPAGA